MDIDNVIYHIPALLTQSIDLLDINPEGVYIDATFGGGGHSREILRRLGPEGHLLGFDRDLDAIQNAPDDPRFTFVHSDYRYVRNFIRYYGIKKVDGIFADLGVSFHHFDTPERGFSFRTDAPLDMRMNTEGTITAADVIQNYAEVQLRHILKINTDLKNSANIAKAIVSARNSKPITTTFALVDAVSPLLNPKSLKKDLAQVFQALRIEVNDEARSLEILLETSPAILKPGGTFGILTYHSGEDRLVKNFFKKGTLRDTEENESLIFGKMKSPWYPVTRTPVIPSEEEIEANPRARSAKLRVAKLREE